MQRAGQPSSCSRSRFSVLPSACLQQVGRGSAAPRSFNHSLANSSRQLPGTGLATTPSTIRSVATPSSWSIKFADFWRQRSWVCNLETNEAGLLSSGDLALLHCGRKTALWGSMEILTTAAPKNSTWGCMGDFEIRSGSGNADTLEQTAWLWGNVAYGRGAMQLSNVIVPPLPLAVVVKRMSFESSALFSFTVRQSGRIIPPQLASTTTNRVIQFRMPSFLLIILALALLSLSFGWKQLPRLAVRSSTLSLSLFNGKKEPTVNKSGKKDSDVNKNVNDGVDTSQFWPGEWVCADCGYVYDREVDGNGLYFEQQPRGFICPQCSAPRKRYAKKVGDKWGVTRDGGDLPIYAFTIIGLAITVWFALVYVPTL
eukprot:scaffold10764_cov159-Ochromonas_danica.AAC.45